MARSFGYGALLRTPGAWTFLLPAFVARMPYAMLGLGTVLLVFDTTHSYTTAGAVAAVASITQVVGAPLTGRLSDRRGQAVVLLPCLTVHAGSVVTLVVLALAGAPIWSLFLAAGLAGASLPQIGAMVRARWLHALDGSPEALSSAFAFESVTDELTFVLGPVLATTLCTTVAPAAGLVAEVVLTVVGGLAFAAQRRTAPPVRLTAGRTGGSALAKPGVRLLVVALLGVGTVFGAMQVSVTAASEAAGQAGLSGLVYGLFAGGSVIAGTAFGAVHWKRSPKFRLLATYTALVVGCSTLWAMPNLFALGVAAFCCGLAIAPTLISAYTLVETLVDTGAKTEAFTWLTGAIGLGLALGSTAAGRLIDSHGAHAGFLVPAVGAGLGLIALLGLRNMLTPAAPAASRQVTGSQRPEPVRA
ncbi:MFS transporter [Streptacidiphilus fuscans]|uniref:MFS transporter n=1 Tax=Streptacidiphilus fuscans TaxID=2789292 RepID=A0A931BBR1_9ACTN|nr:MFS transporter [Streptacidiphilus fuscans]MBF9072327.1 MFS transporter [Streptacidiphilus fuscans]